MSVEDISRQLDLIERRMKKDFIGNEFQRNIMTLDENETVCRQQAPVLLPRVLFLKGVLLQKFAMLPRNSAQSANYLHQAARQLDIANRMLHSLQRQVLPKNLARMAKDLGHVVAYESAVVYTLLNQLDEKPLLVPHTSPLTKREENDFSDCVKHCRALGSIFWPKGPW